MFRSKAFLILTSCLMPLVAMSQSLTGTGIKRLAYELTDSPVQGRGAFLFTLAGSEPDIYVADATGGKPRRLGLGNEPALSPDGQQIAYCVENGISFSQIQIKNIDGSGHRDLTHLHGGGCEAEWSPNGRTILFTHYLSKGNRATPEGVYSIGVDGSNLKRLSDGYSALWSPDGQKILFHQLVSDKPAPGLFAPGKYSIWTMGADGSNTRKIIEASGGWTRSACWLPDGSGIAFTSVDESKPKDQQRLVIYRVNLDGSDERIIAQDPNVALFHPAIAPDGNHLLVLGVGKQIKGVMMFLLDLKGHQSVTVGPGLNPSIVWEK